MSSRIRPFSIIALHGAPHLSPPGSTLASFGKAMECGADALCIAVRATSDNVLMADHESTHRFHGQDVPLREQSLAAWQNYYATAPLTLLADVLALAKDNALGVVLDVREPGTENALARALRQSGLPMTDILVCFPTAESRRTLRGLDPRIPHALMLDTDTRTAVDAKMLATLDTDAVIWAGKLLTPAVVAVLRLREIVCYAWDIDGADEMRRLRDTVGVDGIVTRRPEVLANLSPT